MELYKHVHCVLFLHSGYIYRELKMQPPTHVHAINTGPPMQLDHLGWASQCCSWFDLCWFLLWYKCSIGEGVMEEEESLQLLQKKWNIIIVINVIIGLYIYCMWVSSTSANSLIVVGCRSLYNWAWPIILMRASSGFKLVYKLSRHHRGPQLAS